MILESNNAKEGKGRDSVASEGVRAATNAVRRIFGVDGNKMAVEPTEEPTDLQHADPMSGWSDDVSLRKSHFCLLLKPQFVLRSETDEEAVCIMTAVQGKLQTYNIMDTEHADDPVSGNILTRFVSPWTVGKYLFNKTMLQELCIHHRFADFLPFRNK